MSGVSKPRGIRNCNPLNIRRSRSNWQGLREEITDTQFCQFVSMRWGWRAAFKLLCETYYARWKLRTVREIINRWAPASDGNNPALYAARVATGIAYDMDKPLPEPSKNPALWRRLAWAMAKVENGNSPMDYEELRQGFALWFNDLRKR